MRLFSLNDFLFILAATRWTILLSLLAFALGGLLGAVIAVLRISKFAPLRLAAAGYVQLFQGTPLLMQLFLIYYGLSLFGWRLDAWTAVTIAYTIYAAAFLGDIWRGCIQAIPKEQGENRLHRCRVDGPRRREEHFGEGLSSHHHGPSQPYPGRGSHQARCQRGQERGRGRASERPSISLPALLGRSRGDDLWRGR